MKKSKKLLALCLILCVLFSVVFINSVTAEISASAYSISDGGIYYIRNVYSGLYLDLYGGQTGDGTPAIQRNFSGNKSQQFKLEKSGSYYRVIPMNVQYKSLQVSNSANGSSVFIYDKSNLNQDYVLWTIAENSDGSYRFLSKSAGGKAMVVKGASKEDGKEIIIFDDNGSTNGYWELIPVLEAATISNGTYYVTNKSSNLFLDVKSESTLVGATVAQYIWNGGNNQIWKFTDAGDGYYYIIPMHATTKMLGTQTSTDNDKRIDLWSQGTSNNVKWKAVKNSDGSYRFLSKATGESKIMVIRGASDNEGADIITYADNGSTNGHWYLNPASGTSPSGDNKLYIDRSYGDKQNCFGYAIDVVDKFGYDYSSVLDRNGYKITYISTQFSKPTGNEKLIAFRYRAINDVMKEFHVMKYTNGIWTHKPGSTHPLQYTRVNSDGSLVNTYWSDEGWIPNGGWKSSYTQYTAAITYIKYVPK